MGESEVSRGQQRGQSSVLPACQTEVVGRFGTRGIALCHHGEVKHLINSLIEVKCGSLSKLCIISYILNNITSHSYRKNKKQWTKTLNTMRQIDTNFI